MAMHIVKYTFYALSKGVKKVSVYESHMHGNLFTIFNN